MIVAVGNDHAGYPLKGYVIKLLKELGHKVIYFGSDSQEPVDFPDIAKKVCNSVRTHQANRGIMVCGTGVGASIAANKFPMIRAAVCHDTYSAHQCVEHDDVNVLCVGAQIVGERLVKEIITAYLQAEFSTEEHFRRRVRKLRDLEFSSAKELQDEVKDY